ncbi:MAG: hypothetical protein JWL59_1396 [Chthoniobacteraceae bacterium]|nr:hypothetical protein [Chthoniobacteraceae bacterium]
MEVQTGNCLQTARTPLVLVFNDLQCTLAPWSGLSLPRLLTQELAGRSAPTASVPLHASAGLSLMGGVPVSIRSNIGAGELKKGTCADE